MERRLPFYVDQLGFRLISDSHEQIGRWVVLSPPDGTASLVLVQPDPDAAEYGLIGRARYVIFVTDDVESMFLEWSERGVRFHYPPKAEV